MSTPLNTTQAQVNATPHYETITGVVERLTFHSEESGYTDSYATISRFTRYLKTVPGFEPAKGSRKNASPRVSSSSHRPLTPSRVTALVLRRPELIQPNEREVIAQLQTAHSDLKSAIELAQQESISCASTSERAA